MPYGYEDDDDDEFGADDLFSHPDLLASIEKVEKEHQNQSLVKQALKPVVTGGTRPLNGGVGNSTRDETKHHAMVKPAVQPRARGRAIRTTASPRPTTSHLAPKPVVKPPPASPPKPAPAPPQHVSQNDTEDDDDYELGFGVFVTDEGGYQLVPPEQPTNPPVKPAAVPLVIPPVSDRKTLERSTSLNFETPTQGNVKPSQGSTSRAGPQAVGSQSGGTGGFAGTQFKRTMSAGALARQQAMAKVIGNGSQSTAQSPRPVVNSVAPAREPAQAVEPGPGVGMDEYERMKAELETMRRAQAKATEDMLEYKREAQKRQGEAVGMRKQLVELQKKSEETTSELKQKYLLAQEDLKKTAAEHKKQLESVQSQHTFDVHNNKAHKFYPSQKPTGMALPMIGRGTPARSQTLLANALQTPSRSPGRNQRSPRTNRHWQAELMPPPAPPAFVDPNRFKTPQTAGRMGPSQRKIVPPKPAPSPGFNKLQDSFSIDPDVEMNRITKRPKQSRMSMTPAFGEDEMDMPLGFSPTRGRRNDSDGFEMDFAPPMLKPPLSGVEESDEFQIGRSDADLRGEVIHILFHHAYIPANTAPERSRVTTIQRILNMQTTRSFSDQHQDFYDAACSGVWEALGDNHLSARDTCLTLLSHLITIIVLFREYQLKLPLVATMRLIAYMSTTLPLFLDIQEDFGKQVPRDLLVSIATRCRPDEPVARTSPVKSKQPVGRGNKSNSTGRLVRSNTAIAVPPAELPENKVDIDASELGRALVAFASTLGYDLDAPPAALTNFASDFTGLQALLASHQPLDLVLDALDFTLVLACYPPFFRLLLMLPLEENVRDPKKPPMVELLCGYLRNKHAGANETTTSLLQARVLCIFSTLCTIERDALTLLGDSYFLLPTLISFLVDQSEMVWGVAVSQKTIEGALQLLVPALSLLHHLVFPPAFGADIHDPSTQPRAGVNLMERLVELLKTREFASLHHSFYTALPRITHAEIGEELENWSTNELKVMQDLALDILEALIDAPEEQDGIFMAYRSAEDVEFGTTEDELAIDHLESMGIDPGLEDETEARILASPVARDD